MLGYTKSQAPYQEAWNYDRFLVVKKIADRFEQSDFSGPSFTLMRLEDNVNPDEYNLIAKQCKLQFKKVLFKVPKEIFDYAVRTKVSPKYHYSDYDYNPYGEDIATILKLTAKQLADLVRRY